MWPRRPYFYIWKKQFLFFFFLKKKGSIASILYPVRVYKTVKLFPLLSLDCLCVDFCELVRKKRERERERGGVKSFGNTKRRTRVCLMISSMHHRKIYFLFYIRVGNKEVMVEMIDSRFSTGIKIILITNQPRKHIYTRTLFFIFLFLFCNKYFMDYNWFIASC